MKKLLSVTLIVALTFALCGCVYMEDHFTLNEDGSGNLYSYVLIEKEAYDALMGIADSMTGEEGTAEEIIEAAEAEFPVINIEGIDYYEMEESQDFATIDELKAFLEAEYEDVRVNAETISFTMIVDEEETDGMTYEEMRAEYDSMGIDLDAAVQGYMLFNMPAPIVSTTGTIYEDEYTAIYYVDIKGMFDGVDVFVTTSETEAANEKIRNGVENTKITLKSSYTSKGKIKLSWKKSAGYKVDYYEVFRSTKKSSGYGKKAFYKTPDGKKTTYINSKVKSGTRYYYKVRGVRIVDGEKIYTPYSNKAYRKAK